LAWARLLVLGLWIAGLWAVTGAGVADAQGFAAPPGGHRPDATPAGATPAELEDIGIEDKSGAAIPRDVKLVGSDGRALLLGEYMDGDRPLLLVLAYYGCPMLCSMVLNGTLDAIKGLEKLPGKDYRVLVVSFDPRDDVAVAREKRASYVAAFQRPLGAIDGSELAGFEFATGTEAEVRRLSDAVGFRYRWDDAQQQYAHAAGIFVITPDAKLSTTLTGVQYAPRDVDTALGDAQRGVWRSPLKSALLFCFQYNPQTGKYTLIAGRAMQAGALVTILAVAFLVWRLRRAERLKAARSTHEAATAA
jgi:protein SCO1/2